MVIECNRRGEKNLFLASETPSCAIPTLSSLSNCLAAAVIIWPLPASTLHRRASSHSFQGTVPPCYVFSSSAALAPSIPSRHNEVSRSPYVEKGEKPVDNLKREVIHLRRLMLALVGNFGVCLPGCLFCEAGEVCSPTGVDGAVDLGLWRSAI